MENYTAAYADFKVNAGNKTNLAMGLRYEYTNSNLGSDSLKNIVDRHYGNLFPRISLNQTIDDNHTFTLSYNRRITRPKIWDLAPFVIFFDPFTYVSGNPALQPALIDNVEMNWVLRDKIFHFSYSYEKNSISNFFPTIDSTTNIETFASRNLDYKKTFSAVVTIPLRVNEWWTMSNDISAIWEGLKTTYNGSLLELSQKTCKIQSTQTFQLPHRVSMEISGYYQSPAILFFYKLGSTANMDIHLQKKFGNKGTFQIIAQNVLNTNYWNLSINEPSLNLVSNLHLRFGYPVFKVSYSCPIGHKKIEESRKRETGTEDIMSRMSN